MSGACKPQAGQAMAEGLLVLSGLAALWMAISWLYRVQDMALSAQHATSYLAFAASRRDGELGGLHGRFFTGPDHQWIDLGGRSMLSDLDSQVRLEAFRSLPLPQAAQPGSSATLAALRQDWELEDRGVLHARLTVMPGDTPWDTLAHASGPSAMPVALKRHTAILTGAGHAGDDGHVQQILVQSRQAWRQETAVSYGLSGRIRAVMGPVDSGWSRALPDSEWVSAWAGLVPAPHIHAHIHAAKE